MINKKRNKSFSQQNLDDLLESQKGHKIILTVILINALAVGLQTSSYMSKHFGSILEFLEDVTLGLFVLEVVVRFWAQRARFFKGGWNIFDVIVIGVSLIPHEAGFSVLRSFRILKSLSIFKMTPHMQHVVNAAIRVWPRVFVALVLMGISFYTLGVVGVELFGKDFPNYFGDLGWSIFTLFRLMQSDGYGDIALDVMGVYPYAWIFFLVVTVILAFVMLNLFVGIVVDAVQGAVEEETTEALQEVEKEEKSIESLQKELKAIKSTLAQIQKSLKK